MRVSPALVIWIIATVVAGNRSDPGSGSGGSGSGAKVGRSVSYDGRSFMVDSERLLVLSGSIHYARVPEQDWDRVLKLAKGMGLNTVQTYVFWSFHERVEGTLDWAGPRNLTKFIQLADHNGL